MTDPTCPRCDRPIVDMAWVCEDCTTLAGRKLLWAAAIADEATATVAKLARLAPTSARRADEPPDPPTVDTRPGLAWLRSAVHESALFPTGLPYSASGSDRLAVIVKTLTASARQVAEDRGIDLPDPCTHRTCGAARNGAIGPICPDPLAQLLVWLHGHLDWHRRRPNADELLGKLENAATALIRLVDRPPTRVIVGQCGCTAYLYAVAGTDSVRCPGCGTTYDVNTTRDQMRQSIGVALFTAAECATMAAYLGLTEHRLRTRNLITQWARRGRIIAHGTIEQDDQDADGKAIKVTVPTYRFGDVLERLAASSAAS